MWREVRVPQTLFSISLGEIDELDVFDGFDVSDNSA
jgi:hypothetical protein